jgi:outer membrane protein W
LTCIKPSLRVASYPRSGHLDVKKIRIETDLFTPVGYLTTLKIDPLIVGVGLGWKF